MRAFALAVFFAMLLASPTRFIGSWLKNQARLLRGKTLIHLSGPVGTCKSTLAKLIASVLTVHVILVDELGKNQQFFLIDPDGTKTLVKPDSVLPERFIVVVANCGSSPNAYPNEKKGVFPAVAHQKLGRNGNQIALAMKSSLQNDGYHIVEMWRLLDALINRFDWESARDIWLKMVFDRPDNSYVRHKTKNGQRDLTFSQKLSSLRKDWAKGSMPWAETVNALTQVKVSIVAIQPEKMDFEVGYLNNGVYVRGKPPGDVVLNRWYGRQQLPVQKDGQVKTGRNVPHVTLGNNLPYVETLNFSFRVYLMLNGKEVGVAKYARSGEFWYHMTEKADGISPAMLGADLVKNALDKFEDNAAGGGAKAD